MAPVRDLLRLRHQAHPDVEKTRVRKAEGQAMSAHVHTGDPENCITQPYRSYCWECQVSRVRACEKAQQAMHDLCVWTWCQGCTSVISRDTTSLFSRVYTRGRETGRMQAEEEASSAAREIDEFDQ
jgi:hypothetical protein